MRQKQFGAIPEPFSAPESAKTVIVPVPYEGPHSLFKGSDKGPEAIIEASAGIDLYDILTDSEVWKTGIHTSEAIKERSAEKMNKEVSARTLQLLKKKKFPVILGGEQAVAIGAIKAAADFFKEKDLTIVQLDAHAALQKEYGGSNLNHFCLMTHANDLAQVIHAGTRSMSAAERELIPSGRIFYADNIMDGGNKTWMYDFLNKLTRNVFVTIDLDVLDPALMPAVATPVPGGLQWNDLLDILGKINEKAVIAGVCICGLTPIKYNKAPNFVAAQLINKIITMKFTSGIK